MKYIASLILLIIITLSNLYSQDTYQIKEAWDFFKSNELQTRGWETEISGDNIQGSPYLNDDFIDGVVYTSSKFQFNNIPLRYNIYNNELEFKTPENKIHAIANPENVERVEFGDFEMVYLDFNDFGKREKGFLRSLVEGDASLYAKSEIILREPTEAGAFKQPEPAKFISKSDSYFIRVGNETAKKIRSKKEIIELLANHQEEIEIFIKNNKTRPRDSASLQELIEYYNSL